LGYETRVGDNGKTLSGGQEQRIAIARTILADRSNLLFDEATSAIDYETEAAIQRALQEVMGDRTTVLVAHRLSTVRHADWIYVLDKGTVVEEGRHEDLVRKKGLYSRLWRIQTGETPSARTPKPN
jgi:ATP-binding cassette, subfamily B, bacterial